MFWQSKLFCSICLWVFVVRFRWEGPAGLLILAGMIWHCFCLCLFFKDMVKQTKAKTFQAYLDSCHRRYSCVHCRAHLANHDDLISKVRVTLCDFCGTFTARFVNCDAVCVRLACLCIFSHFKAVKDVPTCSILCEYHFWKKLDHILIEEIFCLTAILWFQGERGLWSSRGKAAADRSSCCGWYLLWELPYHTGLEICKYVLCFWENEVGHMPKLLIITLQSDHSFCFCALSPFLYRSRHLS